MKDYSVAGKLTNQRLIARPVTKLPKKNLLIDIICSLFVLLFSYAAVSKLTDYHTFSGQLAKSPYLEQYALTVAWLIPVTECSIALLLLFRKTRLTGLFASFGLMLAFTIYIYMMLHYSYYVPCSCGGVLTMMNWTQHFWFNVFFTLLSLTGILLYVIKPKDAPLKQPS